MTSTRCSMLPWWLAFVLLAPAAAWSQTASLWLTDASAEVVQTGDTVWELEKVGALVGNTVGWVIEATEQPTVANQLVLAGHLTVANTGAGPATIGNIVVNLQTRIGHKWVTLSSNVADATDGDDATTASIHKQASSEGLAWFTENSASGSLNFMDATNNTVFSLVPQVMIGAGTTKALLFSAAFDNNNALLQLAPGTQIRAEVIVSFGNATQNGNSTPNVDINGNGTLDADEGRVRSVPSRLGLTVPAAVNGNSTVTLTDTIDDIEATGDVTFSNVVINLGATSGTVTANVVGGTDGGSITNCAHLTSADQNVGVGGFTFPIVDGVDLQSCSTVEVAGTPPTCTPGAPGCGWKSDEMETGTQALWGDGATSLGALLTATFDSTYPGDLILGGTFTMRFTDSTSVFTYLPANGAAGGLTANVINPISTSSGELGGELTTLNLNVDYSSQLGNAVALGSLRICGLAALPAMNGQTVTQVLAIGNHLLGGGVATISPSQAAALARLINGAFVAGAPSTFAQSNLVAGNCPST